MKKNFFHFLLVMFGTSLITQAQESSLQFSVGYGFASGSQKLGEEYASTGVASTTTGVYGSYGAGLNLAATYTKMFSRNIGLDLSGTYLSGKEYSGKNSYIVPAYFSTDVINSYLSGFMISPAIVLRAGDGNIRPYMKAGVAMGFFSMTETIASNSSGSGNTQTSSTKIELTGGNSFGFRGGFGIDFNASKKVSLFSEVIFTSMTYAPKQGEITEYIINGSDKLSTLSVSSRQVNFKTSTSTSTTPPSTSEPAESIQSFFPVGSVSLNFGVKIKMGRKIPETK